MIRQCIYCDTSYKTKSKYSKVCNTCKFIIYYNFSFVPDDEIRKNLKNDMQRKIAERFIERRREQNAKYKYRIGQYSSI